MDQHPPIPIPPSHQWREFRIKRIPLILFCAALATVVFIWKDHAIAPGITGEVETISADVISTQPGLLAELHVERFDRVAKNQVIGKLLPVDPDALKASLVALEIELKTLRARAGLDRARNEMDYEKMRLDYLNQRVDLASARITLEFAQNEYQRHATLFADKLVSKSIYEQTKNLRDARAVEVSEKEKILAQMEQRLARMATPPADTEDTLAAAIAAEEAKLLLVEGPITLRSPIDGVVATLNYQAGERVMAGLPIATISAPNSVRIIGYIRQPLTKVPKTGDVVQIIKRGSPRQSATARVLGVGSDFQLVTLAMQSRTLDTMVQRGLPFFVSLPEGLEVRPGELVDLRLLP